MNNNTIRELTPRERSLAALRGLLQDVAEALKNIAAVVKELE